MSPLAFRNVTVDPAAPVEQWPFEAVVTAVERGGIRDWRRLAAAVADDPWGPVARQVEEAVALTEPYGTGPLLLDVVADARRQAEAAERAAVAEEVAALVRASGWSQREFAQRIGTSAPRLSTYLSGKVVPSAALMVRMRRVARHAGGRHTGGRHTGDGSTKRSPARPRSG